jgi:hypothetical protein
MIWLVLIIPHSSCIDPPITMFRITLLNMAVFMSMFTASPIELRVYCTKEG